MSNGKAQLLRFANAILRKSGYQLSPIPETNHLTALELALYGRLATVDRLGILQVGANDGKWGDPLWRFLNSHPDRTSVLFCEPQPEIAKLLSENYSWHPRAKVLEVAVSELGGEIELHRVRPKFWDSLSARYLRGAPSYRAPSGFASSSRTHVLDHLSRLRFTGGSDRPSEDELVESLVVPSLPISSIVRAENLLDSFDLLQVDIEGDDDLLVVSALEDGLRPALVNFEVKHLSANRLRRVQAVLEENDYVMSLHGADGLAFRIK